MLLINLNKLSLNKTVNMILFIGIASHYVMAPNKQIIARRTSRRREEKTI